jgi:hypothetical protein
MNDIVLVAGPRKAIRSDDIVGTFQSICAHQQAAPRVVAA